MLQPVVMFRSAALLLSAAALVACSGIAYEPADGKPLFSVKPGQVVEPVPRAEPVLAAGNTSPYRVNGKQYTVLPSSRGYREQGVASWYGRKFHGRNTANGEVFNAYAASAAHRSLPIPTYARVTNLENGRSMVVRVNDRGPFHADRIIDLSYGAAVKLGFEDQGTAQVEVVALSVDGSEDLRGDPQLADWKSDYRYIQVGSFSQKDSATALSATLRSQMEAPVLVSEIYLGDQAYYRVRIGPVDDRKRLLHLHEQLQQLGYSNIRAMPD
ncbi:MAG: septal ring lytic transglycosylase RlpA family protein [Halieaceae bacterium]